MHASHRTRLLRALLLPLALGTAVAAPSPASALVVGNAEVEVGLTADRTAWRVCVSGTIDLTLRMTGGWRVDITGVRDGLPFTMPTLRSSAASYTPPCSLVPRGGTGAMLAAITYAGVGVDVAAAAVGGAVWSGSINQPFGTST